MNLIVKHVDDKPNPKDGLRILVDRLWPRGLSKEDVQIDVWAKTIAPSNELRRWFQHDVHKWTEFKERYFAELEANVDAVNMLLQYIRKGDVVFYIVPKTQSTITPSR